MACFLVPAAEAVVTTVVAKTAKKRGDSRKDLHGQKIQMAVQSPLGRQRTAVLRARLAWRGGAMVPIPYGNVRSGGDHRHAAGDGFCRRHHGHLADGDLGRYVRGGRQSDEA